MGNLLCVRDSSARGGRDGGTAISRESLDSANSDEYAMKMQIDDEVLVERYRHKMQGRAMRPSIGSYSSSRPPPRVSFRAESFDSQASTESEHRTFIMRLIDSLPETYLDAVAPEQKPEHHQQQQQQQQVVVAALVNEYLPDAVEAAANDEVDEDEEAFAAAPLSDSSHTYESIGSVGLGRSRERDSPPQPQPHTARAI